MPRSVSELASVTYRETYRDEKKDGKNRKRVLMTVELQRHDATLSGEQADELVSKVIGHAAKSYRPNCCPRRTEGPIVSSLRLARR